MRTFKQTLLLAGLLSASFSSWAAAPVFNITIQCSVISLPKEQALRFTAEHRLDSDAATGLRDLLKLVDGKKAESAANPAVTTKSGQKAVSAAGTTHLEVEPVLSPTGDLIDVNIEVDYLGKKVSTSVTYKNGEVKFLGAFDSAEASKNATYFVFVRARASG